VTATLDQASKLSIADIVEGVQMLYYLNSSKAQLLSDLNEHSMPLTPDAWSVVIVGHWNRAILTPSWIARVLFDLSEGTPIQVLVPIDTIGPYQIKHGEVTVIPSSDRLIIKPDTSTIPSLLQAMAIGRRALQELPRTPMLAAGFNLRFKSGASIEKLSDVTGHEWDDRLSDADYRILSRTIARSLEWKSGKVQVLVEQEGEQYEILMNFNLESRDNTELADWLSVSEDDIAAQRDRILQTTLQLSTEDVPNA
jgi:hypothetical protein